MGMGTAVALQAPIALALAFALDAVTGEYPSRLHPVVWMGRVVGALERRAPSAARPWAQLLFGAGMALAVPALFAGAAWATLAALRRWPVVSIVAEAALLKSTFAVRALGEAARDVQRALAARDLPAARGALRSLCSRDASRLDEPRVAAAAVESVAENLSDSFVAPLLFHALLGVPGAVAYRAANTLDARIGYHGRYEWLGKASARLDDVLNLVPARVTAALLLAAGALMGRDAARGARVLRRDGGKTESPNAGRPMAAMAGLLGVELEKVEHYRLGDPGARVDGATIGAAWRVASLAAALALGLAGAIGWGARVLA